MQKQQQVGSHMAYAPFVNLGELDALLRVPRQSLYWEAQAILQLSLNVLHLKSWEIQSNRCAQAILPSIAFLGIDL